MITKIGICAGQVLLCLEIHQGQIPMNVLLREIDASLELILMAVGWLARECYLEIHGTDPMSSTLSLKKSRRD